MAKSRPLLGCAHALLYGLLSVGLCCPVVAAEKNPNLKDLLSHSLRLEKRLTSTQLRSLSNATQNRFAFAHQILEANVGTRKSNAAPMRRGQSDRRKSSRNAGGLPEMVPISSPAFDYTLSRGGGFSQNDSSTAWCGPNVVTGYNDSSAVLQTLTAGTGGLSFSGVAHSGDSGKTFSDLGYLNPGSSPFNFLVGNPSVACANASRFYYASMFATTVPAGRNKVAFKEAIGINTSSDGGATWSEPSAAVLKNSLHLLERESLAVDPANPMRLYISYTDIDFEAPAGGPCPGQTQMLIGFVASSNGGETWGTPRTVERVCGNTGNAVNGSQVTVDPSGLVYVTYLFYDNVNGRELVRFRRSLDHGTNFQTPVDVTTVVPAGSDSMLQGFFLSNEYPVLAVDRSMGTNRGTIYLAWTDGRNHSQLDLFSGSGVYNFADVLLVKSVDQGRHWTSPIGVSPAVNNTSRDQFMPELAVDTSGKLAVCYSDRRNDPQNDAIDHYCSVSEDGGGTFQDLRLTSQSWSPAHSTDLVLNKNYMQDYDFVSPDWTGSDSGFFAAFQFQSYGNPNVYGARF